jgi:hypothetical protein
MFHEVKIVLEIIQNWFNSNKMLLNYKKTKFMQCFPNMTWEIGLYWAQCKWNKCSNSIKLFGVITDSSLTWREHMDYINSKLNCLGYMMRSLRPVLGLKIILQIYFSYVHSVLNYGTMFWGISSHSRPIFITKKRIVRSMMKAKPMDYCRELFKRLGILTLYSQYIVLTQPLYLLLSIRTYSKLIQKFME